MPLSEIVVAVVVTLGIAASLLVWRHLRRRPRTSDDRRAEIKRIRLDEDISEIRRGDRPEPPAPITEPGPDNLEPFARPSSNDERR
jgi:hypothetical protein